MHFARPVYFVAALCLFIVSACSQRTEVNPLEPQFGTVLEDRADAVTYDPKRGASYVTGVDRIDRQQNPIESGGVVFVRRYTQKGNLTWQWREDQGCCFDPYVSAASVDDAGNVYLGWSLYSTSGYAGGIATLLKLSPEGRVLYRRTLDNAILDFETDRAGYVYLAGLSDRDESGIEKYFLRKYNPQGRLVWERLRTYDDYGEEVTPGSIAAPFDLSVAEDGTLYVAGRTEGRSVLTKYSGMGRKLWERAVPDSNNGFTRPYGDGSRGYLVSVGGGSAYLAVNTSYERTQNRVLLLKYTERGDRVWQRTVLTQGRGFAEALDAGRDGSVHLAGYTLQSAGDTDVFARRYKASGEVAWTHAPRLERTAEAVRSIATRGPDNIYLAGFTNGKVNGVNRGGQDAFLTRLDRQGQTIWSR